MLLLPSYCRPTGAGAVSTMFAVIASIVLLYACDVANAQSPERHVLSAGERGDTVFWVFPNQFGIVPTDAQAFDAVAEEVAEIGNRVLRKNKDRQIIIAETISPKHTYDAIRAEASALMGRMAQA